MRFFEIFPTGFVRSKRGKVVELNTPITARATVATGVESKR
jgi:hypothetical protein